MAFNRRQPWETLVSSRRSCRTTIGDDIAREQGTEVCSDANKEAEGGVFSAQEIASNKLAQLEADDFGVPVVVPSYCERGRWRAA